MRRQVGRAALFGFMAGLATFAVVEVVRPRGGTGLLVDWAHVREAARGRLGSPPASPAHLAAAARAYRAMASKVEDPLLEFVGGLPRGASMPQFEALDRQGWLDLNVGIMRRVIDPVLEQGRMPNSLLLEFGRTGLDHYVALMLAFLGRRVLGQFDPQLLGAEPVTAGVFLVETNVEEWQQHSNLPADDLRRWLILHEMTHAWQFAAHPWLKGHMEDAMRVLLETASRQAAPAARIASFVGVMPTQWRLMRRMQGTMSLVEGYSNLVMNQLGDRLLPGFRELEAAYRERSSSKSPLEVLILKLTGMDLKLQQYRRGEAFAQAIYRDHGMEVLNWAWEGPEQMPRLEELEQPERWYRRVGAKRD
jgi:coenzyme F420 biosynthesis associated uncharacterized protein